MALPLIAFSYLPRNRNKCVNIYNLPGAPFHLCLMPGIVSGMETVAKNKNNLSSLCRKL